MSVQPWKGGSEANFELVLEKVFLVWNLAIEAKEPLFVFAEGLPDVSVNHRHENWRDLR